MAGDLVQVFRGPRPVVELLAGLLRSDGVPCAITSDSLGGMRPDLDFAHGSRLLVRRADEDRARMLIEETEPLEAE